MRLAWLTIVGAIAAGGYAALPTTTRTAPLRDVAAPVRGVMHVHTDRSDGTGTVDSVAAAAAQAGLQFVIITDHGNGMRRSDPPSYRHGVLCIDAVEISTEGGHIVAVGASDSPYPLGGETRSVLEDVRRLGGLAFAAHPGSLKPSLRWTDWNLPIDGLEWLNADSEWRDERWTGLVRVLFTFPVRARESLASILDRPVDVLQQWDALTARRQVTAVAAHDAHARIGLRSIGEPFDSGAQIHLPRYATLFRVFSLSLADVRFTGEAGSDAVAVLDALRRGHVYSTIDAVAEPGWMAFTATSGKNSAAAGDTLALDGPVTLRVETRAPPNALVSIFRDGQAVRVADGTPLVETVPAAPAVYRVEVNVPGAPGDPTVPWIVSNPIYVGRSGGEATPAAPKAPTKFSVLYDNGAKVPGAIEASEDASGALDVVPAVPGSQVLFRFALGGRLSRSPYVAFRIPAGSLIAGHDRLMFTARAFRPMRISVQLRVPGGADGERWQRTVPLDETPRSMTISFGDMTPRGATAATTPALDRVDSVLFVVDPANTTLGSSGQIWIDDIKLAH